MVETQHYNKIYRQILFYAMVTFLKNVMKNYKSQKFNTQFPFKTVYFLEGGGADNLILYCVRLYHS